MAHMMSKQVTVQWPIYLLNYLRAEAYCFKLVHTSVYTVKFLNFETQENFPVFYLKFKQRGQTLGFHQKHANGIANSEDPDQTAPLGAV